MSSKQSSGPDPEPICQLLEKILQILQEFHARDHVSVLRIVDEVEQSLEDMPSDNPILQGLLELYFSHAFYAAYASGQFQRAYRYAERERQSSLRAFDSSILRARALNNRGLALLELGQLAEAETDFKAALAELSDGEPSASIPPLASELRCVIERNLAMLYDARGDRQPRSLHRPLITGLGLTSERGCGQPLPFSYFDTDRITELNDSFATAQRLAAEGDVQKALVVAAKAVAQAREPTHDFRTLGIALSNLGHLHAVTGDFATGIEHLEKAVSVLEQTPRPSEPLARALYNLASAQLARSDIAEASEAAKRAWLEIKAVAPNTPMALIILRQLASLRIIQGDLHRARAALYHAMSIYDANRAHFAASEEGHAGVFSMYRSLIELMLFIAVHERWSDEALALVEKAKARFWNEHLELLVASTDEAAAQNRFSLEDENKLVLTDKVDGSTKVFLNMNFETNPQNLLLNFFVGPNAICLVWFRNGQLGSRRVLLSEAELEHEIEIFLGDLQSSSRRPLWRTSGKRLADLLFGDIDRTGPPPRHVVVAPDGPLWFLPFDCLPWASRAEAGEDVGSTLAGAPMSCIPNVKLLGRLQRLNTREAADPACRVIVISRSRFRSLQALPSVGRELDAICRLAKMPPIRFSEDDAVRRQVLPAMETADLIHVATHALADPLAEKPAIVLSDGHGGDDAVNASEIASLRLRARLVFLSACSTAVGRPSVGEGLTSIARAFLLAGCRSVIAALWPVIDNHAAILAELIYERLFNGTPPAEALCLAKKQAQLMGLPVRSLAAFALFGDGDTVPDINSLIRLHVERLEGQ